MDEIKYIKKLLSLDTGNIKKITSADVDAQGSIYLHSSLASDDFKLEDKKVKIALNTYALNISDDEIILMQLDDTATGSADVGFLATHKTLYFTEGDANNIMSIDFDKINSIKYTDRGFFGVHGLQINGKYDIVMTQIFMKKNIKYIRNILRNIQSLTNFNVPTLNKNIFYVECINCGVTHKNPTKSLCSKCGKDMYTLDTNIKCTNCGNEYENTEIVCPYCGN